jgi:long-chain fatty acid transport protein
MTVKRAAIAAACLAGLAGNAFGQAQLPGYGHAASGMGGASIAVPYDSVSTANNPAGMAYVGTRADFVFTGIYTTAETNLGPFSYDASDFGFGPMGGYNQDMKNGWTLGVSFYGFGSAIDYGQPFPGSTTDTTSSVVQLVAAPTATYRIATDHAIGVALLAAAQKIEITGLQSFGFQDPGSDTSYGLGGSIGYLGTLAPGFRLGVSYASKIDMGRLDKYANLLADAGNQDIPQQVGVGLAWQATPQLLVAFDYLWIDWSSVKPLGNPYPGSGPPGSPDGPGSGWQDQSVYRLGVAWDADARWTLRAGATYKSALLDAPSVTLNTLTPLVPQFTLTLGATYRIDARQIVTAALAHNFEKSIAGTGASTGVDLTSSATFFTLGYGYAF